MKFFVSYAGPDLAWAKWVVWELESCKQKHQCIVQFRDFVVGQSFTGEMRRAMDSADCTLAIFSKSYFKSEYCRQELNAALTSQMLPVRIEACDPGRFLSSRIYIDLFGLDVVEARERLLIGTEAYVTRIDRGEAQHAFDDRPVFPGIETQTRLTQIQPLQLQRGCLRISYIGSRIGGLNPENQLEEIKRAVAKSRLPDSLEFLPQFTLNTNSLFDAVNSESPDVLHISGKQNGGDVLMYTDRGTLTRVSDMALAGMFRSLDRRLKLVIMDTCYSLPCARTIAKVVPAAMGVAGSIYEDDATQFYKRFYQALGAGRPLSDCAEQAASALRLKGTPESEIPQLCCSNGIEASDVFLVDTSINTSSSSGSA